MWISSYIHFCFLINVLSQYNSDMDLIKYPVPQYIHTENGIVKGQLVKEADFSYMAYLGIPYAAAPVRGNRFKAPIPPMPWSGVYEANRTVQCPQAEYGEEDCLVINIFTPVPNKQRHFGKPLPVLAFIHGGDFIRGSAPTTGMEFLLKRDIAVVTFNYRLGVIGFLCLGTTDIPGNAGLKDQVAALQWVQRNIINFGGHPKHVVLYGTDAGAASVELLILSKMSRGLFKGAIIESGSANVPWAIDIDPLTTATKLAETLDFVPRDVHDLSKFYIDRSADDLTAVNDMFHSSLNDGTVGFAPCIEASHNVKPCNHGVIRQFLKQSPYDILSRGDYDPVPLIVIFSSLEGLSLKSSQYYEQQGRKMNENFDLFLPVDLTFETDEDKKIVAEAIKLFYFGNKTIGDRTLLQVLEYFGDSLVLYGMLKSTEFHSTRSNVYLMEFLYNGGLTVYERKYMYKNFNFAGHSAASEYVFVTNPITEHRDLQVIEAFAEILSNFLKFNQPTAKLTPRVPLNWPRVDNPKKPSFYRFDEDLMVGVKPHWWRKRFWDNVYRLYRMHLQAVEPTCCDPAN